LSGPYPDAEAVNNGIDQTLMEVVDLVLDECTLIGSILKPNRYRPLVIG
jgi:hypothetical protein